MWSIDILDISDYKIWNDERCGHIFVIIDNFSNYTWCIPLKNKNAQTVTNEFLKNLTQSERKPFKKESDRRK